MTPFDFSAVKLNWFPGHMATGLRQIRNRIQRDIDLIIEVRDARIPVSSRNPLLDELVGKQKIVVYGKSDLGEERYNRRLDDGKDRVLLCKDNKKDLSRLLDRVKGSLQSSDYFGKKNKIMVIGIPNVGKSTIINGLRHMGTGIGGKAAAVGNLPGVTRSLSELICIHRTHPLIYLVDTPGIIQPKIVNVEEGLKIALCGGIYDKTVDFNILSEYLLHLLRLKKNTEYEKFYKISNSTSTTGNINDFLLVVAERIGAKQSGGGGEYDLQRASEFFIRQFRTGKFGRFTLDT